MKQIKGEYTFKALREIVHRRIELARLRKSLRQQRDKYQTREKRKGKILVTLRKRVQPGTIDGL